MIELILPLQMNADEFMDFARHVESLGGEIKNGPVVLNVFGRPFMSLVATVPDDEAIYLRLKYGI